MTVMSDDDREMILLTQPGRKPASDQEEEGVGAHLISDRDIESLKLAAVRLRNQTGDRISDEAGALLEAVDTLLVKGGWADPPERETARPAPPLLSAALPAGEIVEGHSLPRSPVAGVNRPRKADPAPDEEAENETAPASDWSGDGVVLPIELIGVLHDSIVELALESSGEEDNPARDALAGLIEQMEGILEALPGSEHLTALAALKKNKCPP